MRRAYTIALIALMLAPGAAAADPGPVTTPPAAGPALRPAGPDRVRAGRPARAEGGENGVVSAVVRNYRNIDSEPETTHVQRP
jgi:hypothetical protein